MSAAFTPDLQMRVSSLPSANNTFHLYLADASGRKVAALWGGNDEKMANGYLWSAAADLYAALDALIDSFDDTPQTNAARAALAKARGES